MWKQRSRALWLHEGDSNTRYFHSKASHRFRRNRIEVLENHRGEKCEDENGIANILVDFYQSLFASSLPDQIEEALVATPTVVSEEMNQALVAPFEREEVELALKQMDPLKAPGPDGMPPLFFQHFWPAIGDDVVEAVLTCLNSGSIPSSINRTFITLIPKVKSPVRVSDYRPIALCNTLYKLISKVLANRLKTILPCVISDTQSAFQSSKAISDNILVAFETLHHMKNQKSKKGCFMALKLDMSKAYDRVEWVYLVKIMERLGFCEKWVSLVYECISSVSYSILVNGESRGDIRPSRGLRQEDPLSPYLFLLCSKGLNRMLQRAAAEDGIRGFSLCRRGPKISHLFFADDSLLFCRASLEDLQVIQNILSLYEKASGQKLNREKTIIFFSKAVHGDTKNQLSNFLQVPEVKEYEKYLGLPAVVGRNKTESLNYIKERVWSKLQGWKEKLLSQAGREILLKAVVQAIPTFAMSCFKLLVWRLLKDHNSLFFRVFKAKYFPNGSIFEAHSAGGSYAWQSILKARRVISMGMQWRIGDGKSINVYNDSWLPGKGSKKILSPKSGALEGARVAALINPNTRTWDQNVLQQHFLSFEVSRIQAISLCWTDQDDCLIWPGCKDGNYSVKTGYQLLCESATLGDASSSDSSKQSLFWKRVWKLQIPNKIKVFLWRVCSNALPTLENLKRRKILDDAKFKACLAAEEDTLHAIWSCEKLQHIWFPCFSWVQTEHPQIPDVQELISWVGQWIDKLELFAVVAWFIWNHRNRLRLNEKGLASDRILQAAMAYLTEFQAKLPKVAPKPSKGHVRWCPPMGDRFKTNYDGAVFSESGEAGLGVVFRNAKGEVIAALAEKILYPGSVEVLEALAVRRAVNFIVELGIAGSEFEGDSEVVCRALRSTGSGHSSIGQIQGKPSVYFLVVPIQRECFFFMGVPSSEAVVCFQEALRAELEEEDGMGVGVGVVEMRGNEVRVSDKGYPFCGDVGASLDGFDR
ncbi:uncharacterized protein LOC115956857 [Quercus lobata]|uniref:uncharacterized protein LOC115956857 n=1 Tax=Quercus lobata TaxID=97700 RepID=UPI00124597C9|nr:uncharacterized protein LOC115956857 [Quercus lobata]